MGGISLWQVLIIALIIWLPLWVFARIIRKAGYSGWWALIILVPFLSIVMVWVFAFSKWPRLRKNA